MIIDPQIHFSKRDFIKIGVVAFFMVIAIIGIIILLFFTISQIIF